MYTMNWLLDTSVSIDAVSVFIYTWTFIDAVVADQRLRYRKALLLYRNITIFLIPFVSYGLYISAGLLSA